MSNQLRGGIFCVVASPYYKQGRQVAQERLAEWHVKGGRRIPGRCLDCAYVYLIIYESRFGTTHSQNV